MRGVSFSFLSSYPCTWVIVTSLSLSHCSLPKTTLSVPSRNLCWMPNSPSSLPVYSMQHLCPELLFCLFCFFLFAHRLGNGNIRSQEILTQLLLYPDVPFFPTCCLFSFYKQLLGWSDSLYSLGFCVLSLRLSPRPSLVHSEASHPGLTDTSTHSRA